MSSKVLVVFTCFLFFGQIESEGPTLLSTAAFFGDPTIGQSSVPTKRRPPPPIPREESRETQPVKHWRPTPAPRPSLTKTQVVSQEEDTPTASESLEDIPVTLEQILPERPPPLKRPRSPRLDESIQSKRRRTVPPTPRPPFASPQILPDVSVNPEPQKNRPKGPGPPPPKPPRLFLPLLSKSIDQPSAQWQESQMKTAPESSPQGSSPTEEDDPYYEDVTEIRKGLGLVDYPTETTPQSSNQATGEVSEAEQTQEPIYAEVTTGMRSTGMRRAVSEPTVAEEPLYASIAHQYQGQSLPELSTVETPEDVPWYKRIFRVPSIFKRKKKAEIASESKEALQ